MEWFAASPGARLLAGAFFFVLLAWLVRRYGRGMGRRGVVVFAVMVGILFLASPWVQAVASLLLVLAALGLLWRGQPQVGSYQAAIARIEGGGIKRGLTPPEAAVVLGRPLNVTLTLVLFEMLRKGFVLQVRDWPLTVGVAEAFRTHGKGLSAQARGERRRKAAQAIPATLHVYEEAFLEILEANPDAPVHEIDYGIAVQPLVRYVAGRVGGFGLEETRGYYRLIIERAPKEARSDGVLTFERQKVFDRNFGWVLLGEDYAAVLDAKDYAYLPVWLRGRKKALGGTSFAQWVGRVFQAMEGAVREEEVKLSLERETDLVSATLMNEIARATFYG